MNSEIEEVKSKIDIVSLISEYLDLKKAGRNYKANCPFHGERTPSFMISPELQMYKCFGCGESGDVFSFIQKHEGMEFGEALKYLADKAGVELKSKSSSPSKKEKIYQINKDVLYFYNYFLHSHPSGKKVLDYLLSDRGLSLETIKKFKLGYSPDSFTALNDFLVKKKKYSAKDLSDTGLLVGRGIDRFKNRVIFPLFDHRENVIGFAGRILPWSRQDMAKYINSPDTESYHKSKVLYGLNITKSEIRHKNYAVVVEGELDMISSYQAGIKNVIAIKGSALTEDQIRLISRFTDRVVMCLDADFAGNEAAKRGAILAEKLGLEVKVAQLEKYKDPDEAARKDIKAYELAIKKSLSIWDFLIDSSIKKYGLETGESKRKIGLDLTPLLASIDDEIMLSHYTELLSRKLSVPVEAVWSQIKKHLAGNKKTEVSGSGDQGVKTRRILLEEKLLANLLLTDPGSLSQKENSELFTSQIILKIIDVLTKFLKDNKFEIGEFKEYLPGELKSYFSEVVFANSELEDVERIIKELKVLNIKDRLNFLSLELKKPQNSENDILLKEFSQLTKKLSTL